MKGLPTTLLLVGALLLSACGSRATATPVPYPGPSTPAGPSALSATSQPVPTSLPVPGDAELLEVTFTHGLGEDMEPLDPGADFAPDETVYLSLKVKGRPKTGIFAVRFHWRDELIADASVDLADVNSGVIFSIGENTYVGYTLTHENPFPVGAGYRAEVFFDDEPLGSHPFRVNPPSEAIPSEVKEVTTARVLTRTTTRSSPPPPSPLTRRCTWWGGATWGWTPGCRPTGT